MLLEVPQFLTQKLLFWLMCLHGSTLNTFLEQEVLRIVENYGSFASLSYVFMHLPDLRNSRDASSFAQKQVIFFDIWEKKKLFQKLMPFFSWQISERDIASCLI